MSFSSDKCYFSADLETKNETTLLLGNRFLISKYTQSSVSNATAKKNMFSRKRLMYNNERCFLFGPCRDVIRRTDGAIIQSTPDIPCGGGVEYLHRSPASRRRRHKRKSRIWENKIWSRVQRNSDPRMNALAHASSNCKYKTHSRVREDVI
jgi:hypothetical protein